jgi:hypothetical protein
MAEPAESVSVSGGRAGSSPEYLERPGGRIAFELRGGGPLVAHHFVSWSSWRDAASRDHWRTTEGFTSRLEKVRSLCDEFRGANYTLEVEVSERQSEAKAA